MFITFNAIDSRISVQFVDNLSIKPKLLIVEDESIILMGLTYLFVFIGYEVESDGKKVFQEH
jgi:hypothetical protein